MLFHRHLFTAALIASTASAFAADSFSFTQYTGFNDPAVVPGSSFSVTMNANQSQGWVDFTFAMDLAQGVGVITRIWFEQGAQGLGANPTVAGFEGGVNMPFNSGSTDPAGAAGIDWQGTFVRLSALPPPVSNGIEAGESLTIRFQASDDFFNAGLDQFATGEARIAFHIQAIGPGGSQSAHFVSTGFDPIEVEVIPLPSPALLAALALSGGLGISRPRRR